MNIDPFLIVSFVGASEDQVVFDDDSGGGTIGFNAKVTYLAPHSGTYIVAVSDTPGAAIGSYYLSVSEAPDGAEPTMIVPESTIAEATTYVLRQFIVEEGKFELRMGSTAYWGYEAQQRIPTIPDLIEIVMGPIKVGDTVSFSRCYQSGARSTQAHHMTIERLGIDFNLDDGRWGSELPGGHVGVLDDPANNCEFTFTEPGEYLITDSLHPDGHGVAKFTVDPIEN